MKFISKIVTLIAALGLMTNVANAAQSNIKDIPENSPIILKKLSSISYPHLSSSNNYESYGHYSHSSHSSHYSHSSHSSHYSSRY